ncbi:MAG: helix-turn-helix transcriptional regulator [Pseudomonadota bacterium]
MTDTPKRRRSSAEDKAIGTRLRLRRKECGLTQEVLGEAAGISLQEVQEMEEGLSRISALDLWRFSGLLRKDLDYFFIDLEE